MADLGHEFEPSEQTIYTWLKQAGRDQGKRADVLFRKKNRRLQQGRDMLAKAAAWFARETDRPV
ncbi:MAG: hypothetical protein RhofKO_34870 [Rhodothermales bacterium]